MGKKLKLNWEIEIMADPNAQNVKSAPPFCQYSKGPCDQDFTNINSTEGFFVYPSQPIHLARTVSECVRQLQDHSSKDNWRSWESLNVGGQIVFCEICKAIRGTKLVVANITTTNFNVLFELGYALGLRKPVFPIRDTTYEEHGKLLDEIGVFDTLGYDKFTNSNELLGMVRSKRDYSPPLHVRPEPNRHQPIHYMKDPVNTDGSLKLLSSLKKSYFQFSTFDVIETPRLSIHEAYKNVLSSVTIVAHLLDPARSGAIVHNARVAFICGMALACGKHVLMLQESSVNQPIDYRDLVIPYTDPNTISYHVRGILESTAETLQSIEKSHVPLPKGLLEKIDMGDVAAENEIQALSHYFVITPQFQQIRQGHARLVIGRKGAGKTALFYGIRDQLHQYGKKIIVDLKPEGHQFTKLREMVLSTLSEGLQLHALTAFWHYLLLLEIANKLIEFKSKKKYSDAVELNAFTELMSLYEAQELEEGDFSERLMLLVDRLIERFPQTGSISNTEITKAIYEKDIKELNDSVMLHLQDTEGVLILFDNIDKGFPTQGLVKEDIYIIRSLLEATRKMQRTFVRQGIDCLATVFLRRDVYDHLVDETPDRGKEPIANLDWSDIELVKELLLLRFRYQAPELEGSFADVWAHLFVQHVGGESSFRYILSRTFLRPRDILNFVRKCLQVAVSRRHSRVEEEDIRIAEQEFSEDMLNELVYEIRDVYPDYRDLPLIFIGCDSVLSREFIELLISELKLPTDKIDKIIDLLLWFSFIGVKRGDEDHFSYLSNYNMLKLQKMIREYGPESNVYVIHPAFRSALALK